MSLESKFSLWFLAALGVLLGTVVLCSDINAQTNSGPITSPQFNSNFYVGVPPYPSTIQSAATAACTKTPGLVYSHKGTIYLLPGMGLTDTPTAATGCTGVGIVDQRVFPWVCYAWGASGPYAATSCAGGGSGGAVASVSGAAGNRAASVTPTTGAVVVTTFDQTLYASQYSTLDALATACGGANTKIVVDTAQSFTLTAPRSFAANCVFDFRPAGIWTIAGAFSLTFDGQLTGALTPHFAGAASILGLTGEVPAEWFGAVRYPTFAAGAAGVDNTLSLQAALNALTGGGDVLLQCGFYPIASALQVTLDNVAISGECAGNVVSFVTANSKASVLLSTTAGSDGVDFVGTSGARRVWNGLHNLIVQKSVIPTGTAAGVSVNFAGGYVIDHVYSFDFMRGFYFHNAPSFGIGSMSNASAGWGSASGSYTTENLVGAYLDSADGIEEESIVINHLDVGCAGAGSATTVGFLMSGTALGDDFFSEISTTGCSYGAKLDYTGGTAGKADNIHFSQSQFYDNKISGILVNNARSGVFGTTTGITFDGGVVADGTATTCSVDIENSTGVTVQGFQLEGVNTCVNNSEAVSILNNMTVGQNNSQSNDYGIQLSGSKNVLISGNNLQSVGVVGSVSNGISLSSSSTNNVISGNTFKGVGWGTGINCDGTSGSNTIGLNSSSATYSVGELVGCGLSYQIPLSITNTGTSGAATLSAAGVLNIPIYGSGSFVNPMMGVGDFIYGGTAGAATRLVAFTVAGTYNICETPTGSPAAPTWCASPKTLAAVAHNFLTSYDSSTGTYTQAQPVEGDVVNLVSDLATLTTAVAGKQTAFGVQTANTVYAGPTSGGSALPSFRSMIVADIPSLSALYAALDNPTGGANNYAPLAGPSFTGSSLFTGPVTHKQAANTAGSGIILNSLDGLRSLDCHWDVSDILQCSIGSSRSASFVGNYNFMQQILASGGISSSTMVISPVYNTTTNCASAVAPAVCGSAAAGAFVIAAAGTTVTVNTTAITANSEIEIQPDTSLGTRLGVTCNTLISALINPTVTARVSGTSFTVTIPGAGLVTNPACYSYTLTN